MLHGDLHRDAGEDMQAPILSSQQETIEQEATGTLESITALMGGDSETLKITSNI